jgi:thiol:disulfide interchange protein DsbC
MSARAIGVRAAALMTPLTLVTLGAVATSAVAESDLAATLRRLYPATRVSGIQPTPIPGLSAVHLGEHVAYVDRTGRYFLFGSLYDMQTQQDLTAAPRGDAAAIDFDALPIALAIRTVRGAGTRRVAVFADPDCPYCRTLEAALATLDDVTVYTFLHPVDALHPGARERAIAVWCAPDPAAAWATLMATGRVPAPAPCAHPIDAVLALGAQLALTGTPTLFAADGRRHVGTLAPDALARWLDGPSRPERDASR